LFQILSAVLFPPKPQLQYFDARADTLAVIAGLTFVVSSVGTASTILPGWRAERRQAQEFQLKIKQLELQVAELTKKNVEKPD
jgi:hypothetical protein